MICSSMICRPKMRIAIVHNIFLCSFTAPPRRPTTMSAAGPVPSASYSRAPPSDDIYAEVRKEKRSPSTATPTSQEPHNISEERTPPQVYVCNILRYAQTPQSLGLSGVIWDSQPLYCTCSLPLNCVLGSSHTYLITHAPSACPAHCTVVCTSQVLMCTWVRSEGDVYRF